MAFVSSNVHWYLIVVCYAHMALTPNNQSTPKPSSCHSSNSARHPTPDTPGNEESILETTDSTMDSSQIMSDSRDFPKRDQGEIEENCEPLVYFKSLDMMESPSDMSCSDQLKLFVELDFESNHNGENQHGSESDKKILCEKSRERTNSWLMLATGTDEKHPGMECHRDETLRERNIPSPVQVGLFCVFVSIDGLVLSKRV